MKRITLLVMLIFGVSFNVSALAEEVAPGIVRTPDARFENLVDFPFAPNYMQIEDVRIHYLDEGPQDGETILLLHGEPTWSYLFRKMIPVLVEAGYRVVVPDLVGFGKSDKYIDESAYSYEQQVEVMSTLVTNLDLRDVTFFGQDWGGLIGLRVVADAPERFARIVVSNTGLPAAGGVQGWLGYPLFKLAVWWEGAMTMDALRADLTFPRWVAYSYHIEDLPIGDLMGFMGGGDDVSAAYEAPFPDQRYKAAAQIMPYLVPSQLRENEAVWQSVYETWDKPFLVAFTDADPITRGMEKVFLERVPTAQNVVIRGAGHFVQEDAGPELAQLMLDFMAGRKLPAEIQPASQVQAEWVSLFNGEDLTGWTPKIRGQEVGEDRLQTFRVEDGLLTVSYENYDDFDDQFGHLFYSTPFSRYRLRLEYRFVGEQAPGGESWAYKNSGVMIHSQPPETMPAEQNFPISIEVQFLGGLGGDDPRPTANMCSPGTHIVYEGEHTTTHCIPSRAPTFHGDEWITMEVLVDADERVVHYVNGEAVQEYGGLTTGGGVVGGHLPEMKPEGKALRSGHIALQSESHPIQFRNIEIQVYD